MKKISKFIIGTLCALFVAGSVFAAGTNTSTEYFKANELSLTLGTGYALNRAALFQQPYSVNAYAGASYFFTKYLGLEADLPFYNSKGTAVSDVKTYLLLRLPVNRFALYGGIGGDYNWTDDSFSNFTVAKLSYLAKVGGEVRLTPHIGIFVEDEYQNNRIALKDAQQTAKTGLRFAF